MPIPGYMWITDENGAAVPSDVKISGRSGSAEILGFEHEIRIPCDKDSGALTGTRKHEDFIVTKTFCSATPILYKACTSGKNFQHIKISWYRINTAGIEQEYFRHTLSDVKIVAVKPIVLDVKDKTMEKYGHLEKIHFRYGKIRWEYLDGNIATEDEWNNRA